MELHNSNSVSDEPHAKLRRKFCCRLSKSPCNCLQASADSHNEGQFAGMESKVGQPPSRSRPALQDFRPVPDLRRSIGCALTAPLSGLQLSELAALASELLSVVPGVSLTRGEVFLQQAQLISCSQRPSWLGSLLDLSGCTTHLCCPLCATATAPRSSIWCRFCCPLCPFWCEF
jgi:hypothetical protein